MNEQTQTAPGDASVAAMDSTTPEQAQQSTMDFVGACKPALVSAAPQESAGTSQDVAPNPWAARAQDPNRDLHVQTREPLYDKQNCLMKLTGFESVTANGETGEAVRLVFETQGELTTTEGIKKSPGQRFSPFPYVIEPASQESADKDKAERGRRDLGRFLEAAELMPRGGGNLYAALSRLKVGVVVLVKLSVRQGTKRDPETGKLAQFQNIVFATPESKEGGGGAGAPAHAPDY